MLEVKRRTAVIDAFVLDPNHALYRATTIEVVYLQFRKILELIALGSLVANKDAFSKMYEKFAKYWNAELLIKDMARVNPSFYPKPIIQQPSTDPGFKMKFLDRNQDFLTKDDFIKLYNKCGGIMHSSNPYGSKIDYGYFDNAIGEWRGKIANLLNTHLIRLVNDENMYLIQMGAANASPTYTPFGPMGQEKKP